MKIDRGIVRCDRCKRVFKTKEVNNYKISYQAGGLKSDGGMGLVRKKAEICSDCNMDFEDFMQDVIQMTGEEWSKLCKERDVVVIDANYKDMTHEDAIKYFDLLNTAMDHAFARKYDLETGQYEDYALPEGSTYYEDDMNKKVACCECGKKIMYGASYTSRIILNSGGFGYAVCEDCYYKNDMKDIVKKG